VGILLDTVGDQQTLKNIDGDVVELGRHRRQHLFALFRAEQGFAFVEVGCNRHDEPVEELGTAMDQVQVSVRNWVERSGINGDDILQETSGGGSVCRMILFWLASRGNRGKRIGEEVRGGPSGKGPLSDAMRYFRPAGGLGVACGAASALAAAACALSSTEIRPSDLRTSFSIFAAMSLFSFRNCLAFSRPWPMRSPL